MQQKSPMTTVSPVHVNMKQPATMVSTPTLVIVLPDTMERIVRAT